MIHLTWIHASHGSQNNLLILPYIFETGSAGIVYKHKSFLGRSVVVDLVRKLLWKSWEKWAFRHSLDRRSNLIWIRLDLSDSKEDWWRKLSLKCNENTKDAYMSRKHGTPHGTEQQDAFERRLWTCVNLHQNRMCRIKVRIM